MKQLTCEMCGGTDLVKQDGLFVCQSCGCKYTVEEAKKMMLEVSGTVEVKNAAQLDNLLNLAHSSFESKNYSQAEEFCNQVIAMDDKNYEAWKLKGEAINYQITAKNQRILEVYNCIMTSYRVLSDEDKEIKKYEILSSLKTCFEGEVTFWLDQFEAGRPTDSALLRAKNAYIDAYNKMKAAFEELGLEDSKVEYLTKFDNFFVGKCNATCNSAWKTTVGYNYYRDYQGKGKDPFGRTDQRWVIANTDLYRPSKKIWDTFLSETDNLIALLKFAEEQFNDDTNPKVKDAIFSNIIYFEECVIPSGSWKITQGYTSNWDQYKTVGWHEEYSLTDSAKNARRTIINLYEAKRKAAESVEKAKAAIRAKLKRDAYWEEHAEEKAALEKEQSDLTVQIEELKKQIDAVPGASEIARLEESIKSLFAQKDALGLFKGKEKKALQEKIDEAVVEKTDIANKMAAEKKSLQDKIKPLEKRLEEIKKEFTKDR